MTKDELFKMLHDHFRLEISTRVGTDYGQSSPYLTINVELKMDNKTVMTCEDSVRLPN